jgi:palmitoyltransferase
MRRKDIELLGHGASEVVADASSPRHDSPNRTAEGAAADEAPPEVAVEHPTEDSHRRPAKPLPTRWQVLSRYYFLSTLAVALSLLSPQTDLWKDPSASTTRSTDYAQYSDRLQRPYWVARLVIVYATTLLFLTFALHGSNPGYLTPAMMQHLDELEEHQQQEQEQGHEQTPSSTNGADKEDEENALPSGSEESNSQHRLALLGAEDEPVRPTRRPPCQHCTLEAPPLRSHHCHRCQQHVATFDHHCEFIGTCIGEANHARFWVFLTLQLYGFGVCISIVESSPLGLASFLFSSGETSTWNVAFLCLVRIYLYPLTLAAFLVWITHTFLAVTNSTTFEFVKGSRHLEYLRGTHMMDLPFSQSRCDRNLLTFCRRDASFQREWRPTLWQPPGPIVRDSEKWWEHPWQNKYWSCC